MHGSSSRTRTYDRSVNSRLLYLLSYRGSNITPPAMQREILTGNYLCSQAVSSQVLSAYVDFTTVFGMGTGVTPQLSSPDSEVFPQNFIDVSLHKII